MTTRTLWLSLLLQVFTFSGFLHPCCLGEAGRMDAPHVDAAMGSMGHDGGHDAAQGHDVAPSADEDSHEDCAGCEGNCGLCCQGASEHLAPAAVKPGDLVGGVPSVSRPAPTARPAPLPAPPYLLPFANGPPLSPVATA